MAAEQQSRDQEYDVGLLMNIPVPSISNLFVQINVEMVFALTVKGLFLSIGVKKQTKKAIISTLKTIKHDCSQF